jgi:predicted HAD superfamily Cof-like phosphohydrolase
MSLFDDVGEFHRKFGLPVSGATRPQLVSERVFDYRVNFLEEELKELYEAYLENDLVKVADALADLVWVALGTAHYLGLPFDEVWSHVKRANLDKVLAGDHAKPHKRGTAEVIRKPPDWVGPEDGIRTALRRAGARVGDDA